MKGRTDVSGLLGVAVLGAGHMGADHIRRLDRVTSGARVVAVADPDTARAEAAVAGIDGASAHAEVAAALDAPGVGAVLIASPGPAHEAALHEAFARDLPVLCEKPLVPDAEGALRVVEAEARHGRRLVQVGFMRRYDAEYLRLKALLDEGRLGRPLMLHCVHRNVSSPPGFTSAMLVDSSVSHEIDAARWLLGQEPTAVTVLRPGSTGRAPKGLVDPQFVVMETDGGVLVDVEIFVNTGFGYQVRCEAVCEGGSARIGEEHGMTVTAPEREFRGGAPGLPRTVRGRLRPRTAGLGRRVPGRPGDRPERLGRLRVLGDGRGGRPLPAHRHPHAGEPGPAPGVVRVRGAGCSASRAAGVHGAL